MAALSNHYADVANWVERVIDSCETPMQENTARRLVDLFEDRIAREAPDLYLYYAKRLHIRLDDKTYGRIETNIKTKSTSN
jgi:hypothetical protein